ncbi:MAG: hypothetical protein ABUK13_04545 [Gammaproteobacteria bacterium]
MSNSQKISQFSSQTSFSDTDSLTFIRQGQNFTGSFSDFKLSLGVTGTLTSIGDPLGVKVLSEPTAQDYQIRNIESGKGIIASVSAQNGILFGANFTQSATGSKLIPDLNAAQYKVKTISSGEGISIADDGDTLTLSSTGVATPSNLRFISSESDFDSQTASTITLTPGIFYQIGASFSTAKNFVTQGSIMEGLDIATTLTYTGTGSMFTNTNDRFTLRSIVVDCPNGTVFESIGDDTGNPNHRINAESIVVLNCVKLLTSTGCGAQIFDILQVSNVTGAKVVTFSATTPAIIYSFNRITFIGMTAGSIGFDLGASVSQEVELSSVIMLGDASATAVSGLANSGNITSGNFGSISSCNFSSFTTQLAGLDVADVRWVFSSNAGLPDSISDGLIHTEANALETVIATLSVPVKLNAVFLDDDISRFTSDGTGRLTYVGEVASRLPIDITTTVKAASGGDKQIGLCVSLNGSPITTTCVQGTASSTKLTSLTTIWQHDFVTGDYIEPFLSNETDTINVIGEQCIVRIN